MKDITITARDKFQLKGYIWEAKKTKAVIAIVHGLAEHCKRYDAFAKELNKNDYSVISIDLRGHGRTAENNILGCFADKNGAKLVTDDIKQMILMAKKEYPDVPIILFAHSMGATFGKAAMIKFGEEFKACILSGDTLNKKELRNIAPFVAKFFCLFGAKKPSKILSSMTFGEYNKPFLPARTKFDWLSRDEKEVDNYIADNMCGFDASPNLFYDIAKTILFTLKQKNIDKIKKDMKIFIIQGDKDPCGSNGLDANLLYEKYKKAGLDVEYKLYKNTRHELLNEINRDEVINDIIDYLEKTIA